MSAEDFKAVRVAVEGFALTAEAAVREHETRNDGGMRVPFHGDFANVPPSAIGRLRWWAERMREGLAALARLEAEAQLAEERATGKEDLACERDEVLRILGVRDADGLEDAVQRVVAQAAAMREALEKVRLSTEPCETLKTAAFELRAIRGVVDRALATDAGAALLARLREAEATHAGKCNELRNQRDMFAKASGDQRARAEKAEAERDALRSQSAATASRNRDLMIELDALRAEVERLRAALATSRDENLVLRAEEEAQARREERERVAAYVERHCYEGTDTAERIRALGDS